MKGFRAVLIAASLLAQVPAYSQDTGTAAIPDLIKGLEDENAGARRKAREALILLGEPAIRPLIETARSSRWPARDEAIEALKRLKDLAFPLLEADLEKGDTARRKATAELLGFIPDPRSAACLAGALADPDDSLYHIVIASIRNLRGKADDVLLLTLRNHKSPLVRQRCAYILGVEDVQAAGPDLAAALADADPAVRKNAAFALSRIRYRKALDPLCRALSDRDAEVRARCLEAIGALQDKGSIPAVSQALKDIDGTVRRSAAEALAAIHDSECLPLLAGCLRDSDKSVRMSAAKGIQSFGEAALDAAIPLLKDPDPAIRLAAAQSLPFRAGRRCTSAMAAALLDKDEAVREFAFGFLVRLGPDATEDLVGLLRNGDAEAKRLASDVLTRIGSPAIEPLREAARSSDPATRYEAGRALSKLGIVEDAEVLAEGLKSGSVKKRIESIWLLAKSGRPEATGLLIPLLSDMDQEVASASIQALGSLRDPEGVPHLAKILADTKAGPFLRRDACDSLIRIGPASLEPAYGILETGDVEGALLAFRAVVDIKDQSAIPRLAEISSGGTGRAAFLASCALAVLGDASRFRIIVDFTLQNGNELDWTCETCIRSLKHCGADGIGYLASRITSAGAGKRKRILYILDFTVGSIPQSGRVLAEMLESGDDSIRLAAVRLLESHWKPESRDLLVRALRDDSSEVREAARRGLEENGISAGEAFAEALPASGPGGRMARVANLLALRAPGARFELLKLMSDADPAVRRYAASAAARLEDVEFLHPLRLLMSDEDGATRLIASTGVLKLWKEAGFESFFASIHSLRRLPHEEIFHVTTAFLATGEAGFDKLAAIMESGEESRLLPAAWLLSFGGDRALKSFTGFLGHRNPRVRRVAAMALGFMGCRNLEDRQRSMRYYDRDAPWSEVSETLIRLLKDDDISVRLEAAAALGRIKYEKAVPALSGLLDTESSETAARAAFALSSFGGLGGGVLVSLAESGSPLQRKWALIRLGVADRGDLRSAAIIRKSLGDPDPAVRSAAALALAKCGVEGAGSRLVEMLSDPEHLCRTWTALALAIIRQRPAAAIRSVASTGEDHASVAALKSESWYSRTPESPDLAFTALDDPDDLARLLDGDCRITALFALRSYRQVSGRRFRLDPEEWTSWAARRR